jgi:protein CpxP
MFRIRKNMIKIVVMFCITALTAFVGIAQAHDGERGDEHCGCAKQHDMHGGRHHHPDFKHIAKKLDLTDAQKAQAKAIFEGNKEVVKPIFKSLHAEHKNLKALLHADKIDEAAIRAEVTKIAGIKADLVINRVKTKAKFEAILTPAQLTTLKAIHKKGHEDGEYKHCSHE